MSLLREILGGQRRITPDRDSEPRYTGKTIFTNHEPVPLIQRITAVLFCLGFAGVFYVFLDRENRYGSSLLDKLWSIFLLLGIALCSLVGVLALVGLPPFQSRFRK
jgi:hypothetical protein